MATIRDISVMTGLSEATISRYMNNHPYVSEQARTAIEDALQQIDYRPNASARSLRSGRTRRVAVLIDSVRLPFYSGLLDGFCDAARQHSYSVLVEQAGASGWSPEALVEQARSHDVDGVVIAVDPLQEGMIEALVKLVPVIACDQSVHDLECPRVYVDHYESTLLGLSYLRDAGHQTIACVVGGDDTISSSNRYRRNAYEDFAAAHKALHVHIVQSADSSATGGASLLAKLRELTPVPQAIFSASDELAVGLLMAAHRSGVRVPEDLAILGFDDQPIAEVHGLTTIRQPIRYMGRRALGNLISLIEKGSLAAIKHSTRLKYELVQRDTA